MLMGTLALARWAPAGGVKKVSDGTQRRGKNSPGRHGSLVITQTEQKPDQQQRQPAMKKRKPAGEQRKLMIKHVTGQVQKIKPQQMAAEVCEPEALRQQDAHGAHADELCAFHPHASHRKD